MKKFRINKNYIQLILLFLIVNLVCLLYKDGYIRTSFYVDENVVVVANTLLFLLALTGIYRHIKAAQNPNPNVFIRSVMLMTLLKLFVLGGAAVLYVVFAKQNRNVPGIIIGLVLYVLYAVFEARSAYRMNKKK